MNTSKAIESIVGSILVVAGFASVAASAFIDFTVFAGKAFFPRASSVQPLFYVIVLGPPAFALICGSYVVSHDYHPLLRAFAVPLLVLGTFVLVAAGIVIII